MNRIPILQAPKLVFSCLILVATSFVSLSAVKPSGAQSIAGSAGAAVTFSFQPLTSKPLPVKIIQVLLNGQAVALDSPSSVTGEWVGKIKVIVQNVSPKTIIAGTVMLRYLDTGDGTQNHPYLTTPLNLGRVPASAFRQKDGTMRAIPDAFLQMPEVRIPPGGTMEFHMSQAQGDIDQKEAYREAGSIRRVQLEIHAFYFDDGSKWTGVSYQVPTDAPQLWKDITPAQFFADATPNGDQ